MWLALGLWNRVGRDAMNFSQTLQPDFVPIAGLSVRAEWPSCIKVHKRWKDISSTLSTSSVDTVRKYPTDETEALSSNNFYGKVDLNFRRLDKTYDQSLRAPSGKDA
ncbi:hypothetical protein BFJ66_g11081 [Fusarium oxysporum f. sp. cepae]|uniref:Uncharacterized protein n=1 Tax=Fusarium oxysporum f. sp. cepae TaxID=396571 RepID=A0A3L6NXV3_FUSOX|nr:hypothetical protein BFJ65_g2626 [Fusarium oxysporum f. sp. cepae]RKK41335.1 hypothetical protein BFJ66_g11081 [Fusarium oxysporum f. sp. cepae]